MNQETFEKELAMCRKLSGENGGRCHWGECARCGVVPLLYKIGKGELYETKEDVERIRQEALGV